MLELRCIARISARTLAIPTQDSPRLSSATCWTNMDGITVNYCLMKDTRLPLFLVLIHHLIQRSSPDKAAGDVKLTTHVHLQTRLRITGAYLHSLPRLHGRHRAILPVPFTSAPPNKRRDIKRLRCNNFLPDPFQFIIYQSTINGIWSKMVITEARNYSCIVTDEPASDLRYRMYKSVPRFRFDGQNAERKTSLPH